MAPYDEVVNVMYNSTILFHAETQEDEFQYILRYGFSTKIADSIASGRPFMMYSSPEIAGAQYIIETGAAWFAKDKSELKQNIVTILTDDAERNRILHIAEKTAKNNHNTEKNSLFIQQKLMNCTI